MLRTDAVHLLPHCSVSFAGETCAVTVPHAFNEVLSPQNRMDYKCKAATETGIMEVLPKIEVRS